MQTLSVSRPTFIICAYDRVLTVFRHNTDKTHAVFVTKRKLTGDLLLLDNGSLLMTDPHQLSSANSQLSNETCPSLQNRAVRVQSFVKVKSAKMSVMQVLKKRARTGSRAAATRPREPSGESRSRASR